MARKPTGNDGHTTVDIKPDGNISVKYVPDLLGTSKDEIERTIVDRFAKAMHAVTGVHFGWKQNSENDLDFTLSLPGGDVDLELTELVVPNQEGSPFIAKNKSRTMGDIADALISRVRDKDGHYQKSMTPKHLLVYTTHFPFTPPDAAIRIVQHELKIDPPSVFENIFFLDHLPGENVARCLFPVPDNVLKGFDSAKARSLEYVNFDPTLMELRTST